MSDEPTVEELNSTIKVMEARIHALLLDIEGMVIKNEELFAANTKLREKNTELAGTFTNLRIENKAIHTSLDKALMEKETAGDQVERYEKLIDFLQRYVLDEI